MNKKVPLWFVLLVLWFSCLITLSFGWAVWHIKTNGPLFRGRPASVIISVASFPSLVKTTFEQLIDPSPFIRPNIYPSINGFKMENKYVDSNYILLSTYDKNEGQFVIKLIRIYDQKVIHQWMPNFDDIKRGIGNGFWSNENKHSVALTHPLLSPDGSIAFHTGTLLMKIDKNSKLIWMVDGPFHHSLEEDVEGNIWVPSIINDPKKLSNFLKDYKDDALSEVSPNGKILLKKSVSEILIKNGYRGLLLGVGLYETDLIHLNDIQPALTSGKYWMKGDLLISIRNKSTVALYRPSTNKIMWLKTGPWLNQHDVDFIDSTRIGVFGNNVVRGDINSNNGLIDGHNDEYVYDFKTNKTTTPYTEFFRKAKISTISEGRSDILANGDLFIEETNNNRLLRGNAQNIIWQFVNRIDQNSAAALSWSKFITKEEFKKLTFLKVN